MLIEAYLSPDKSFKWIDVVDPNGRDLEILHNQYGIQYLALQDCLDPKHLPKYEVQYEEIFVMLRAFDDKSTEDDTSVTDLTQKIAIFMGKNCLITIHRREQPFMLQIREKWIKSQKENIDMMPAILGRIVLGVINSFNQALNTSESALEDFESVIFNEESTTLSIQKKFLLKRKAYVFKRVLKLTLEIIPKLKIINTYDPLFFQDLKERCENAYFEAENVLEYVNNLINLHLSLASHNTTEVVRILTIFSVFFLPLTFIVGLYGMNFRYIPELQLKYGYPMVWIIMVAVCVILYSWFRRKGWL